jgi:hypothetical protein
MIPLPHVAAPDPGCRGSLILGLEFRVEFRDNGADYRMTCRTRSRRPNVSEFAINRPGKGVPQVD